MCFFFSQVEAVSTSVQDSSVLVQRSTLDLILFCFPFHMSQVGEKERKDKTAEWVSEVKLKLWAVVESVQQDVLNICCVCLCMCCYHREATWFSLALWWLTAFLVQPFGSKYLAAFSCTGTQSDAYTVCVCKCLFVCLLISNRTGLFTRRSVCIQAALGDPITNLAVCTVLLRPLVPTWFGSCRQLCMWFWEETCPSTAGSTLGCWVRNTHTQA